MIADHKYTALRIPLHNNAHKSRIHITPKPMQLSLTVWICRLFPVRLSDTPRSKGADDKPCCMEHLLLRLRVQFKFHVRLLDLLPIISNPKQSQRGENGSEGSEATSED